MNYLLDTDICIYWFKGKEQVKEKVRQVGINNLRITIITLAELKYGAYYSKEVNRNLEKINHFLQKVEVITLDEMTITKFGQIKAHLRNQGKLIEDFDILNASCALVNNCILVTNNIGHFKRIDELKIENWLE